MKLLYPTLLQSANIINSHSWFDIKEHKNINRKKKKRKTINISYIETTKFKLTLTKSQKKLLKRWLNDCIDVYNLTNEYIKNNKLTKKDLNFFKLRKQLYTEITQICNKNKLQKHTADYAVKHCIEMYKSAFSSRKGLLLVTQ